MKCYKHPDREGTASCTICGKLLCDECQIKIGDQIVCKSCVAGLLTENPVDKNNQKTQKEQESEDKPKKSLFGFLKRDKKETKKSEPRTQETINEYPYGEINNPHNEEIIHEETYDFWDPSESETQKTTPDQKALFESDSYAKQSESPKSHHSIFKRHKMEKPEKKLQTSSEGTIPDEIVIDHSDDEPSQLDTLFMKEEEDEFDYDYTYTKKDVNNEDDETEDESPEAIVINHSDDEPSQLEEYIPQYEESELKKEMENIIDRTSEISNSTEIENEHIPETTNENSETKEEPVKKLSKEEIEDLIYQLHKEGNSPSKIGIILRDQYNVPNIKAATGQKLTKIIKMKEELENPGQIGLKDDDSGKMSIASATESSVINTETGSKKIEEEPKSRPSLKPIDDINGPQVFNYEHGAPVKEDTSKKEEKPPLKETTIPEEPKTPIKEPDEEELETGEIIIEKTPEDIELLKKIEKEAEEAKRKAEEAKRKAEKEAEEAKKRVEEAKKKAEEEAEKRKIKQKATTSASSKKEEIPTIIPNERKQISPGNSVSMQNIIDSSMFVKSYVDNYSILPSSVRIDHKKWNMSEFLYFAVTCINNISEGIYEPILKLSLIDVMHNTEDFKFGTITKDDYLLLSKVTRAYIDTEGRAPFNRQSTIGVLQFRTLVYLFASILTIYKFTNQFPDTYLVNDNVFKVEDADYKDELENQQNQKVVPTPIPNPVSAATPTDNPTVTPTQAAQEILAEEDTPKNLIDELQKNIQEYKNNKINYSDEPVNLQKDYEQDPYLDDIETDITPELPSEEKSSPVSNIKRLMQNSSNSEENEWEEESNIEDTINELKKVKEQGVGDLKESYIDKSTHELEQKPHKLTRSSQSPMPKPKEVIRGKKELIKEDLDYNSFNETAPKSENKPENDYDYEDQEMSDWLVFLISFIIFFIVFGAIVYVIYIIYFQATFGTPAELISSLLK